jgi:hypothetical protein
VKKSDHDPLENPWKEESLMKIKIKTAGVSLLIILLVPLILRAEGRFKNFSFKLKGEITNIITEDMNEDGLIEVILIHRDSSTDPPCRFITIFWHDRINGFRKDDKTSWPIPQEVAAVDVGDVKPDKGQELVFITEKGVSYAPVRDGRVGVLREIIPVQSVVAIASDRHAPYYNFVRDYTGDGKHDILVCGFYDTLIACQEKNYKFSIQKINLKPDIEIFAFDIKELMQSPENPFFRVAYSVPQVFSQDYNADGLIDLLVSFRSKIFIFAQDKNGFSADPVKVYTIKLLPDEFHSRQEMPPNLEFEDLDRDGRVDIVVQQTRGRLGQMKSRNVLFWGKSANIEKGIPDMEFKTENTVLAGAFILDVNGDGLSDLMMPTYDIGVWSIGKVLITGEITVEWVYFLQSPEHSFNQVPDRIITTDLKFNVRKFRLESGIPNVIGDFNGDGCLDQAMGEEENILGITLRDKQGKPLDLHERINVPVSMLNRVVDLNNDGLSDIVIYYPDQPEHPGDLNILLNCGPWTFIESMEE